VLLVGMVPGETVRLFTSGAIEYFHPDLAPKHNGLKCIPSQEFELKVINVVDVLIQAAKHTGVSFPVQASFDLFNARGVAMGVNNAWTMSGPRTIDRDSLRVGVVGRRFGYARSRNDIETLVRKDMELHAD
jgi:hypothetical protein